MPKPSEKQSKPEEIKRLTDYVTTGVRDRLEGERVEMEKVMGEDLRLLDFVFIPSTKFNEEGKKGEFLVMQYNRPGNDTLYTSSCGGVAVVEALKQMPKNYLPVTVRIVWAKSKAGRRYLSIE